MSGLAVPEPDRLTELEARRLTDEVKHDAQTLWLNLLRLHDGDAHAALGYPSWHAYCEAEFGYGQSHSYRLLDAGRVAELVPQLGNEAQARELVPLLDDQELLNDAWEEAIHVTNGKPTAAVVAQAVKRRKLSDEERARILALKADGKTQKQIAEILGRSQKVVSTVVRAAATDLDRLPKRRQAASAQTSVLAKLQRACREWEQIGDEEYIPAPELARRLRVLDQALTFITRKRAHYYALTGRHE